MLRRIRDPWIRTLEYESGSGSGLCFFVREFQYANKKYVIFLKFFAYYLGTACTFTSVFKDKTLLRSHKTVQSKVFLNFLAYYGRIRIRIHTVITGQDPGGPKTYGSGSGTLMSTEENL
jgi:hypothetical protein